MVQENMNRWDEQLRKVKKEDETNQGVKRGKRLEQYEKQQRQIDKQLKT